jgi:hypothetical protein
MASAPACTIVDLLDLALGIGAGDLDLQVHLVAHALVRRHGLDHVGRLGLPVVADVAHGEIDLVGLGRREELTALVEQMWQYSEADDASGFLSRNQAFHFAVYGASGSPTLVPIIESLWLQIGPYLSLLHRSGNYRLGNEHHDALKEALTRGDGAGARAALTGDISAAAEVLLTMVTRS